MEMPSVRRRQDFTFAGSPLREMERARPPRPPGNYAVLPRAGEEEESRWLQQPSRLGSPESAASGTPSPQLWGQGQYQHRLYPASAGSSPTRAQAIAGYRREMLDLVRGLPESAYELSLRDIVDRAPPSPPPTPPPSQPLLPPPPPPPPASQQQEAIDEKQSKKQGRKQRRAMGRTRSRSLERSVSLDTGLLIKLFLPLSVGGGKKKKKVSPKPPPAAKDSDEKKKTKKKKQGRKEAQEEEEEWWKKSEFSEAGSSSRTSSTNSTSTDASAGGNGNGNGNGGANPKALTRSRSRKRNGCYGFFKANKSANGGTQD